MKFKLQFLSTDLLLFCPVKELWINIRFKVNIHLLQSLHVLDKYFNISQSLRFDVFLINILTYWVAGIQGSLNKGSCACLAHQWPGWWVISQTYRLDTYKDNLRGSTGNTCLSAYLNVISRLCNKQIFGQIDWLSDWLNKSQVESRGKEIFGMQRLTFLKTVKLNIDIRIYILNYNVGSQNLICLNIF